MATKKITELTETTSLTPSTDVLPVVNSSTTKKITANNLVSSGLSASFNTQLTSSFGPMISASMTYNFLVNNGVGMTGTFNTQLSNSVNYSFLIGKGVTMTGSFGTFLTASMTVNFMSGRGIVLTSSFGSLVSSSVGHNYLNTKGVALTGSSATVFSGTVERKISVRTITTNGPILASDQVLFISGTANIVLTATSPTSNYEPILIKKIAQNAFIIEIARSGSETIEGVAATYQLTGSELTTRPAWTLMTDGTNHWIG